MHRNEAEVQKTKTLLYCKFRCKRLLMTVLYTNSNNKVVYE
nr:MAG TPA: hypothetical protein [Caudoviricetes sp.]